MGTWEGDPLQAAARFLAEHEAVTGLDDNDTFSIETGHGGLLPPWPPTVNLPGLVVPLAAEPELERSTCAGCGTPVAKREGEWRHELGLSERGGCTEAEG